ncbi:MAG: crossover junction endodeoxyribonuclease RuvC [Candidatus Ryanbacteria bacterium RIFCSPLOWO2_01_FULL_48_26]|uniref:Crossover junction endodeoxyribonuclease RuvC n=1 Tax=Candidatus Ryanbacteria bacterium RIFCSPLOWO2_01_FULL_48_26 TaxID=1802126 RepID=A0A1G2GQX7_9BACT|nr:MAG: crossover junction endodeoxyribonuclease RuvC [Candidatus Ryanbacteria bacterium RIFCSPLOWO2_01_FULL_48_26]
MIILGIDPGTRRIGYGVVEYTGGKISFIGTGLLKIEADNDPQALRETKEQINNVFKKFAPSILSIEKLYFMKNQKTAIQVAQARGVIISAATEYGLEVREFAPNEIKLGVTGYGFTDKKGVLKMVRLILNEPKLDVIDDASDALAVAIIACQRRIVEN